MGLSGRLAVLILVAMLVPSDAAARSRKQHADHRPVTRAEVARELEPVLDARLTRGGRQVTGQDIANIEDSSIHITDEMTSTGSRVEALTRDIEALRREIHQLRRRQRRSW